MTRWGACSKRAAAPTPAPATAPWWHALRHAFACNAHRAGISLRSLQLQLGHADLATTSRYLQRLGLDEVFDEFERAFA